MRDWLAARASISPDRLALLYGGTSWNYRQLDEEAEAIASRLVTLGVSEGSIVAALLPTGAAFVALLHALTRLGATLLPLNTRLTEPELGAQLEFIPCHLLLCSEQTAGRALALGRLVDNVVSVDRAGSDGVASLAATAAAPVWRAAPMLSERRQLVVFTSGTSGRPKAAELSGGNMLWSATASALRLGVEPADRWLIPLPLYHVGGLAALIRCCIYGTTAVLQGEFSVAGTLATLADTRVTLVSLVPTMLRRLLTVAGQGDWPESLRLVLLGGAAAEGDLLARCRQAGIRVATTYGLTEASSQVATAVGEIVWQKPGSVGKPLMFTEVRIAAEDGSTLPAGRPGEIVVQGPTVMAGYYGDGAATAAALRQGELYTGDVGFLDSDGDLWLLQRRQDVIVTGGENVYPVEVEAILRHHPAVAEVCVAGVDDREWGQKVAALVVREQGRAVTATELQDFARRQLAGYKVPRLIGFAGALPVTTSGKVIRPQVAQLLADSRRETE